MYAVSHTTLSVSADRQRKDLGDLAELADSIKRLGQLNPVIIDENNQIIAGERRWRAVCLLNLPLPDGTTPEPTLVLVRQLSSLSPPERMAIELEENIKRKQLSWLEQAHAIKAYHTFKAASIEGWTVPATASAIGLSPASVYECIRVADNANNAALQSAVSVRSASRILARQEQRIIDSHLLTTMSPTLAPGAAVETQTSDNSLMLLHRDAHEFFSTYSGPPFTFIHCDFPYGLNINESPQLSRTDNTKYSDSPELFLSLLNAFTENAPRICAPRCHILFWFTPKFRSSIHNAFASIPNAEIWPYDFIWSKEDKKGVAAAPDYAPRHIYEQAMFINIGKKKMVKMGDDHISASRGTTEHSSEKPIPVLLHFLQQYVDDTTHFLDPTCGSGSSIVVARRLKAARIVGLDLNKDCITSATARLASPLSGLEISL